MHRFTCQTYFVLPEKHLHTNPDIDAMAERIQQRRAGRGIRETAKEVGISPATLSRVENGKVPDLDTFSKICAWLGDDPAVFLGLKSGTSSLAQVHFKKSATIDKTTAIALSEMILAAQQAILEEEL
jgi:transcriptional regulator with XRE-family HTH domain